MYFLCIYLNSQKTGAFSLIWEEVSNCADLFPNKRKCPCFPKAFVTDGMTCFRSRSTHVLSCINSWIEQYTHLSNIPEEMFKTSVHDHWSPQTAKHILSDWRTQFNF